MLQSHILIAHSFSDIRRFQKDFAGALRKVNISAFHFWEAFQRFSVSLSYQVKIGFCFFHQKSRDILIHLENSFQ